MIIKKKRLEIELHLEDAGYLIYTINISFDLHSSHERLQSIIWEHLSMTLCVKNSKVIRAGITDESTENMSRFSP